MNLAANLYEASVASHSYTIEYNAAVRSANPA